MAKETFSILKQRESEYETGLSEVLYVECSIIRMWNVYFPEEREE